MKSDKGEEGAWVYISRLSFAFVPYLYRRFSYTYAEVLTYEKTTHADIDERISQNFGKLTIFGANEREGEN